MVVDCYEAAIAKVMDAQEQASTDYPSILVDGHRLHICLTDRRWEVWINTDERDFDGLCIASAPTRAGAVAAARVTVLALCNVLAADQLKGRA